jgi:hypothetical protein
MGIQTKVARIREQMRDCFSEVKQILKAGDFSEASIEFAVAKITAFADRLETAMARDRELRPFMQDDTPMGLVAVTAGDAIGEHTYAESNLKAGLIDCGNVSIAYASATSIAAAEGGEGGPFVSTACFSDVTGGDVAFTRTVNTTGENFAKSTQYLFAVDFEFLKDLDIEIGREANLVIDAYADVPDGNTAVVNFDVVAEGEDTAVSAVVDVLAIQDTLSSTYVGSEVQIG